MRARARETSSSPAARERGGSRPRARASRASMRRAGTRSASSTRRRRRSSRSGSRPARCPGAASAATRPAGRSGRRRRRWRSGRACDSRQRSRSTSVRVAHSPKPSVALHGECKAAGAGAPAAPHSAPVGRRWRPGGSRLRATTRTARARRPPAAVRGTACRAGHPEASGSSRPRPAAPRPPRRACRG